MFAAILAIGLLLAINFSSRIAAGQPLQEAYSRAVTEVEALRREQGDLIALRDYVRGDAYVEQWARDEGKMVRPGEVLVVPVPSGLVIDVSVVEQPSIPIETTSRDPETWVVWWALFFDTDPPQFE
jgi:hypothetical protein